MELGRLSLAGRPHFSTSRGEAGLGHRLCPSRYRIGDNRSCCGRPGEVMRYRAVGGFAERALELAATGRFRNWEEVGAAMEQAGNQLALYRISIDPNLRRLVDLRCTGSRRDPD